jgi:hypothetical protein
MNMRKPRSLLTAATVALTLSIFSVSALANPGNGNGGGNGGSQGNSNGNGNKGNSGNKSDKSAKADKSDKGNGNSKENQGSRKNYGKPDHVDTDITFNDARRLAVNYGFTGYKPLPPGIAKNLARGKPLPPGIAKKSVPGTMLNQLPYYPGYEWQAVGQDLVLVALSTAIVTSVINGVFD